MSQQLNLNHKAQSHSHEALKPFCRPTRKLANLVDYKIFYVCVKHYPCYICCYPSYLGIIFPYTDNPIPLTKTPATRL